MDEAKKNSLDFLKLPERQSPIAIVLILFRFARLIIRQLWPVLIVFFFNPSKSGDSWITIALAVIGSASALLSIISYFKFYYYVKGDELVIEKGLFQKKKLNVPFDRIQTINFNQNMIHRFFNVVELEIDTAGSSSKEFSISALRKEKAERIRTYILSQKTEHLTNDHTAADVAQEIPRFQQADQLLLHLDIGDLIKVGLGQNHLRSVGIIIGTLFGWLQFAEDAIGEKTYKAYEEQYIDLLLNSFIGILLFLLVVAFFITLISTVIRYYDLRFFKTQQGFKIQSGFFNRKENSANMNKIQFVRWTTNPIRSLFKLFRLQLFQAASSAISRKQSILVPGCYNTQLAAVRKVYFPEEEYLEFETHRIKARIMLKSIFLYGLIPLIFYFLRQDTYGIWVLLKALSWLLFVLSLSYWHYRKWRYAISSEGIRTTSGLIGTSYTLLKWYKIQSVQLRQSVFQKRRHLTDLYLFTAAGAIRIPYIEQDKALALKNYILYKIEASKAPWM